MRGRLGGSGFPDEAAIAGLTARREGLESDSLSKAHPESHRGRMAWGRQYSRYSPSGSLNASQRHHFEREDSVER